MDYKKVLPLVDKIISWATPKRVLQLAAFAVVCVASLTLFEERSSFIEQVFSDKAAPSTELKLIVSPDMKQKLKEIVDRSPEIVMIQVVSANVRINQRDLIFYVTDDPVIESSMKHYVQTRTSGKPIFNQDDKNNAQMVSAMNGEFGCFRYEDGSASMMPKMPNKTQTVCRVSLPPFYGEFSGYVSFTLTRPPNEALQNEIRLVATRMATEIYFKSIGKTVPQN